MGLVVSSKDIENALDFIYTGELNILHEDLERFLEIAQKLKLEELIKNQNNIFQDLAMIGKFSNFHWSDVIHVKT